MNLYNKSKLISLGSSSHELFARSYLLITFFHPIWEPSFRVSLVDAISILFQEVKLPTIQMRKMFTGTSRYMPYTSIMTDCNIKILQTTLFINIATPNIVVSIR